MKRAALLLALVLAAPAAAARPAGGVEHRAIVRALPRDLRAGEGTCVTFGVRVSGRFALVRPTFRPGMMCARLASDGFFVLHRAARWHVVYNGSDPPPCRLMVPRDLVRCRR